jgi:FAD/FMN-containing dehydrogenase
VLAHARALTGDQVTSAEYVARESLDLVLRYVPGALDPLDAPHAHYVLLEVASADTDDALRAALERVLESAMAAGEIENGVIAESVAQRNALWLLRERVPEAEARAGGVVKHDVAVRISRIAELVEQATSALHAIAPHRVSLFGHIGDGNLHFNLLPPEGQRFSAATAAALSACVHDVAARLGGSFSAEHGIGVLKAAELTRYKSPEAVALMRTLKRALDPNGIMNPGKVLRG